MDPKRHVERVNDLWNKLSQSVSSLIMHLIEDPSIHQSQDDVQRKLRGCVEEISIRDLDGTNLTSMYQLLSSKIETTNEHNIDITATLLQNEESTFLNIMNKLRI